MAGPVTSIPAMAALFGAFKPRLFWVYLAVGFTGSVIVGYVSQALIQ